MIKFKHLKFPKFKKDDVELRDLELSPFSILSHDSLLRDRTDSDIDERMRTFLRKRRTE